MDHGWAPISGMRYQSFQQLRQPIWDRMQALLGQARRSPRQLSYEQLEELTVTYRQVLHDYSLASSRFPGTAVARHLRHQVLEATHFLQRDSGSHLPSLGRFVFQTFPRAMQSLWPTLVATTALFLVLALFGFALAAVEPSMGLYFVSPKVVDGLERGELWTESIFAVTPGAVASTQIATNNLSVAITAWAGGVLGGLGALWVVCLNGLMLGSVLALTAHYSMSHALLEFIGAHGPLEITMILVSAAAGLHMGAAMVRATDQPRSVALRRAGRQSLVVLMGCLPWILMLGFVEGFVSPSTLLTPTTKWGVGLLLELVFVLWCLSSGGQDVEQL